MTGYNLPPGCSVTDIPGNRPQDVAWIRILESIAPSDCEGCEYGGGPATYLAPSGRTYEDYTCCLHDENGRDDVPDDCVEAESRFSDWMEGE